MSINPQKTIGIVPLLDTTVQLDDPTTFEACFSECCFDIRIFTKKNENETVAILEISPQAESKYELIVDYFFTVGTVHEYCEHDHWKSKEVLHSILISTASNSVVIKFGLNVRQPLIAEDLTVKSHLRYYRLLCGGTIFYVNPAQLKPLQSELFDRFYNDEVTHESCSVVQSLTENELHILLNAVLGYSSIIVHARNLFELGEIAIQFRIVGVVRAVDAFVRNLKMMSPLRKLELACNFRLTQVADTVVRALPRGTERLKILHDYLDENGESESQQHPDVLSLLDVYYDYIVL